MPTGIYGAWIAINFSLLWLVIFLSLGISLVFLALFGRGRRWYDHVTFFTAVFIISLAIVLFLVKLMFGQGVIITRDFFPLH